MRMWTQFKQSTIKIDNLHESFIKNGWNAIVVSCQTQFLIHPESFIHENPLSKTRYRYRFDSGVDCL